MEVPSSNAIPCITLDDDSEMETVPSGSILANSALETSPIAYEANVKDQREDIEKEVKESSVDQSREIQEIVERLNNSKGSERKDALNEMRIRFDEKSRDEFLAVLGECVTVPIRKKETCSHCQKTFNSFNENIRHIILDHNVSLNCSKLLNISKQMDSAEITTRRAGIKNSKKKTTDKLRRLIDRCNDTKSLMIKNHSIDLLKKNYPHYYKRMTSALVLNMYDKSKDLWICTKCEKSYKSKKSLLAQHLIVSHHSQLKYELDDDARESKIKKKGENANTEDEDEKTDIKKDVIQTSTQLPIDDCRKLLHFTIYLAKSFPITDLEPLRELFENLRLDLTIFQSLMKNRVILREYIKNTVHANYIQYLVRDVGDSIFSIFLNRYTKNNGKFLLLIIKYFSSKKNQISTSFYRFVELESENFCIELIYILKKDGLNIAKCGGFGLDIDESSSDSNVDILKNMNHWMVLNRCVYQSLLLIAVKACSYLPEDLAIMIKDTCNCVITSESTDDDIPVALRNSKSHFHNHRWFMELKFINYIITMQSNAMKQFSTVNNTYIKKLFDDDNNISNLLTIYEILSPILKLHDSFLEESFDPIDLFKELHRILNDLGKYQENLHLFKIQKPQNGYSMQIHECLQYLLVELKKLIPERLDLLRQVTLFSPKEMKARHQIDISNLLKIFHFMPNIQLIKKEWDLLVQEDKKLIPGGSIENCWMKLKDCADFRNISQFVLQMLCLPFSNIEVKRIFDVAPKFINGLTNELPIDIIEAFMIIQLQTEPNIVQICLEQTDREVYSNDKDFNVN